jgi:hypothetical protein
VAGTSVAYGACV